MKKSVLALLLMFVSVLALNAQSLTGKEWYTKLSPDDGGEVFVTLTFEKMAPVKCLSQPTIRSSKTACPSASLAALPFQAPTPLTAKT